METENAGSDGSLPTDPAAYRATTHFGQRLKERKIPGHAVRECIESGEVRPGRHGGELILTTGHYSLAVSELPDRAGVREVITVVRGTF